MEPLERRLALDSSVPELAHLIETAEPLPTGAPTALSIPDLMAAGAGNFDSPINGPDLQPFAPPGWDDSIVISKVLDTTQDADSLVFDTSDTIYFDVAVRNSGTTSSGQFVIDLVLDGTATQRLGSTGLIASSAVAGQDISFGKLPAGQHTVELIIDSQLQVNETDEANNRYARTFSVAENSRFRPDLRVQSLSVSDLSGSRSITKDENVFVDVVMVNAGSGAAGPFGLDLLVDGTKQVEASPGSGVMQPGQTLNIEDIDIGKLAPGPHRVDISVDPPAANQPRGQVLESNETNNYFQGAPLTVTGAGNERPDLIFALLPGSSQSLVISTEPNTHTDSFPILTSGRHVYVDVGVGNTGTASAPSFSIQVAIDGDPFREVRRDAPLNAPGLAEDFIDMDLGSLAAGTHTLQVVIDPQGNVRESDEANNLIQRRFSVLEPAAISGVRWEDRDGDRVRDAGEPGLAGGVIYLDLNHNGQRDSGEPRATTRVDNLATPADETGTYTFPGLAPGTYTVAEELPVGWQQTVPGPEHGQELGFDIDLRFVDDSFSPPQQNLIRAAAERWEQVVVGDLPDLYTTVPNVNPGLRAETDVAGLFVDDLVIDVFAGTIDGTPMSGANVLGQGGPAAGTGLDRVDGSGLPTRGSLQIDRDDLASVTDDHLFSVALHEMGHVLGIGTRWDAAELLDDTSANDIRYLGRAATDEYNLMFANNVASVPAHSDGGHWREETFVAELMTPLVDFGTVPLSRITVASLDDLGFTVELNQADPYAPPGIDRPLVSVTATDDRATEGPGDAGEFRLTRSGPLSRQFRVDYTISGTASVDDFQPISASATFAAGQSAITIPVMANDDTTPEPTESVVLTLAANNSYTMGSPHRATVQIADNQPPTGPFISFTHQVTVGSGETNTDVDFANREIDGLPSVLSVEIVDVNPRTRAGAIDELSIVFSRPTRGFDLSDLSIRWSTDWTVPRSLGSARLTTTDNVTWTLGNLRGVTTGSGIYELILSGDGSGIRDAEGGFLAQGDSTRWTNGAGDANLDLRFDQLDIVAVLRAERYLTGLTATWSQGDWNGDGRFNQLDIIVAQQTQPYHYLHGPFGSRVPTR